MGLEHAFGRIARRSAAAWPTRTTTTMVMTMTTTTVMIMATMLATIPTGRRLRAAITATITDTSWPRARADQQQPRIRGRHRAEPRLRAVEVVYGVLAHSVALLADAGHNFGDVLGLGLSWGATALAALKPSKRRTFGFRRTTIVASVANALVLLFVTGGLTWESIRRLDRAPAVPGPHDDHRRDRRRRQSTPSPRCSS